MTDKDICTVLKSLFPESQLVICFICFLSTEKLHDVINWELLPNERYE